MARTRAELAASLTAEQRRATGALQGIPNVGPAMATDLLRLGVADVQDLATREPDALYAALGALDGRRPDPCVWDVFAAAVAYARGEPARPWWYFTAVRKARQPGPAGPSTTPTARPRDSAVRKARRQGSASGGTARDSRRG
jgi:hypothetical protein